MAQPDEHHASLRWLCLQLGSRELYAIPRALHRGDRLAGLLTDTWIPAGAVPMVRKLHPALALRRHPEIPASLVRSVSVRCAAREFIHRFRRRDHWSAIMERNDWFQAWAASQIAAWRRTRDANVCFSYSYAARLPFREAKRRGMACILGQIDPGPLEDDVVTAGTEAYAELRKGAAAKAPSRYWQEWREEVELADKIVVNSAWSTELLTRTGIPEEKIVELPLAYENHAAVTAGSIRAAHPSAGQAAPRGPLRVLFLGQVILRKGIGQLFEAIRLLAGESIEFTFAGPVGVKIPSWITSLKQVKFLGPVDRQSAERLYRDSDVFILPSLSEGFGLTQLEAQAHGLPVIASRYCGAVVNDGINGILLPDIRPETMATALHNLAHNRELLATLRAHSSVAGRFSLAALEHNLATLGSRLVTPETSARRTLPGSQS